MSDAFTSDTYNALCQEAEGYLNRGLTEQARELLLKAVSLIGTRPRARSILADTCMSLGLWSEAKEQLEVLTTLEINNTSHHFRLGQVLEELGELDLARDNYLVVQDHDKSHRQASVAVGRLSAKLDSQPRGIDLSQVFGGSQPSSDAGGPPAAGEKPVPAREEAPVPPPTPSPEPPQPQARVSPHGDRQIFPDAPGATDVFATTDDLDSLLEDIGVKLGRPGEGDDKVQALLSSVGISLEPPKKPEAEKSPEEEKPRVRDIADLLGSTKGAPPVQAATPPEGIEVFGGLQSVFESPAAEAPAKGPEPSHPVDAAPKPTPVSLDSIFGEQLQPGMPGPGPKPAASDAAHAPMPSLAEIFGGPGQGTAPGAAPLPPAEPVAPAPVEQLVPPPVEDAVPSVKDAVKSPVEDLYTAGTALESAFGQPVPLDTAAPGSASGAVQTLEQAFQPVPVPETPAEEAPSRVEPLPPRAEEPVAAPEEEKAVEAAPEPSQEAAAPAALPEQPAQPVASSPASYKISKLENDLLVGVELKKGTLAVNPRTLVAYEGQITISEVAGWLLAGGSGTVWLGSGTGTAIVHKLEEGRIARADRLAAFDAHIELVPAETALTTGLVRVSRGSCEAVLFPEGSFREVKVDGGPFTVRAGSLLMGDESVIVSAAEGLPDFLVLSGKGRAVVAR